MGLSWNGKKLLCSTTDGYLCVIDVQIDGEYHVLANHYDEMNVVVNYVKWQGDDSYYFLCGGHTGLGVST